MIIRRYKVTCDGCGHAIHKANTANEVAVDVPEKPGQAYRLYFQFHDDICERLWRASHEQVITIDVITNQEDSSD